MGKIVEAEQEYRINIFRNGKLDGIQDNVAPEDVFRISAQLRDAEDRGGRKDSVVEFEPMPNEEPGGLRKWFNW